MPLNRANPGTFSNGSDGAALFDVPANTLRNGAVASMVPIHLATGIHAGYTWILSGAVRNVGGAAPDDNVVELYRLAALYSVALERAETTQEKRNHKALTLAASRLAIAAHWDVKTEDFIANQTSGLTGLWKPTDADKIGSFAAAAEATVFTAEKVSAAVDALPAMTEAVDAAGTVWADYIASTGRAAIGMPVATGVVLVKTRSHHFVEPHKGVAQAIIRQVFGPNFVGTLHLSREDFEDVVCHKASHPFKTEVLTQWARDKTVKARLVAANLASAAVRVPAKTDPEAMMSSVLKLISMVSTVAGDANVNIGNIMETAEATEVKVKAELESITNQGGVATAQDVVNTWVNANDFGIATMYGMVSEMVDDAVAGGGATSAGTTILRAYGLRRIAADNPAAVAKGRAIMSDARNWSRERSRAGNLMGTGLFGAEPPEVRTPPAGEGMMGTLLQAMLNQRG